MGSRLRSLGLEVWLAAPVEVQFVEHNIYVVVEEASGGGGGHGGFEAWRQAAPRPPPCPGEGAGRVSYRGGEGKGGGKQVPT